MTAPEVTELTFGALPAVGRYFTQPCQQVSEGVFRVEVEVPRGEMYYHFYHGNDGRNVILDSGNLQIGAKHWHSICRVGTDAVLPVSFAGHKPFVFALPWGNYGFRVQGRQTWLQEVWLLVCKASAIVHRIRLPRIFAKGGISYFEVITSRSVLAAGDGYLFQVEGEGSTYFLGPDGALRKSPETRFSMDPVLELPAEALTQQGGLYHIFPDRFYRAPGGVTARPLQEWGTEPALDSFFGGNLRGVTEKLPYLADLGVTTIYLTPVFKAASNHRYDCADYTSIDPLLGSEADFSELVSRCHALGMKLILDIVLNHCSTFFWAFQDVLAYQERSRYRDWFLIHKFPVEVRPFTMDYRCWWNYGAMPEFNFDNPEVRKHLLDACTYWVQSFDIDGWRIDVSSEMELAFLSELRSELQKVKPDAVLIGENWKDASVFLNDEMGALDGVTNYLYWWKLFTPFFVERRLKVSDLALLIADIYVKYPPSKLLGSWNILSSHDIPRFGSVLPSRDDLFPAVFLQVALPGTPVVYYGDEIGLEGLDDPLNRGCFDWEANFDRLALFQWYRKLLRTHRSERALREGMLSGLVADDQTGVLFFRRYTNEEAVLCVVNFSEAPREIEMEGRAPGKYLELLSGQITSARVRLEPKSGYMFKPLGRCSRGEGT